MFKKYFCLLLVLLLTSCSSSETINNTHIKNRIYDQVIEVEDYTSLDYEFAKEYFDTKYVDNPHGCSAAFKTLEDGSNIVGRNFDIPVSRTPSYLLHIKVDGLYECIALSFDINLNAQTVEDVNKNGIADDYYKIFPFTTTDYLNSEGLYVEIDMRNYETFENGESKYPLTGTNPNAETSIHIVELMNFVATHCKDVEEAKKYVDTLNIYSKDGGWGYALLMADKSGNHTVLEFCNNKPVWNDDYVQTNFYLDEAARSIEDYGSGYGRYDYIMNNISGVKTEADMFNMMNNVRFSTVYNPDNELFDVRSEAAGLYPEFTYDYLMDENNRKSVYDLWSQYYDTYNNSTLEEKIEMGVFSNSIFTVVANCNNKTLFVRFYEDDDITVRFSFDGVEKGASLYN